LFEDNRPIAGAVGYPCQSDGVATEENENGTRPQCDETLCCGHAFPESMMDNDEERLANQVEICQGEELTSIEYQASWDVEPVTLHFGCIEGTATFMVGVATMLSFAVVSM